MKYNILICLSFSLMIIGGCKSENKTTTTEAPERTEVQAFLDTYNK